LKLSELRFLVLVIVFTAIDFPLMHINTAYAQQTRSPSILEFFGFKSAGTKLIEPSKTAHIKKKKTIAAKPAGRKKPKIVTAPAGITGQDAPIRNVTPVDSGQPPEKMLDAKTILVVGDFMAGSVAAGLDAAFAGEASVKVVEKSNGSSGFIRDDYYNWPQSIVGLNSENKPAVIVVMIGANDRQQLRLNGQNEVVRSQAWTTAYLSRVVQFSTTLKSLGVPVVWIGLPPFKSTQMSADYLAFNDIYRSETQKIGGTFVDIWEGFVDDQGAFTINGFDYTGQPARLRGDDGINLATAGKRKIAFFAEKGIRAALGNVIQPLAVTALGPFALPGPVRPLAPDVTAITRLAPISLFDPAFDGDTELLGGTVPAVKQKTASVANSLYVDGKLPDAKPGRVDDFKTVK
jgi:uncharacterized protein